MEETVKDGYVRRARLVRIQFNDRQHLGWQHNPVSVNGFQAIEKERNPFPATMVRGCFWAMVLDTSTQTEMRCQLTAVVRVEVTEKEVGDVENADADFQQAAHDPRPAVKKQVFPTGSASAMSKDCVPARARRFPILKW
jgi:hypothetical protein